MTEIRAQIHSALDQLQKNAIRFALLVRTTRRLQSLWELRDEADQAPLSAEEPGMLYSRAAAYETKSLEQPPRRPPPWLVGMSAEFIDQAERVDRRLRGRVLEALTELSNSKIEIHGDTVKPLAGDFKGCWRYRIGDYRLIFLPDRENGTLTLIALLPRGEAYD